MTFSITATKRAPGNAAETRATGRIPAVLYGPQTEPQAIDIEYRAFEKLYDAAGESSLIDFQIDGTSEATKVLIQDVQYDSIHDRYLHVDFRQINMKEEMHATVELRFVGDAAAVKTLGGTLIVQREDVEVRCLPQNLVNHLDVDLSALATFDDAIHISDVVTPAGIVIVDAPDSLIAKVTPPLTEDQLKAMEESQVGDVGAVEVTTAKKEEGDAAAEEKKAA